ncbi:Gfo/Idh/MocA family oxidoreductase [Raoultella ornithinolytica]|uniref:Gfo/Idh/MocA family oxidoreductase n=1 Tax=Raoultella ornithinolytica TaxID=54291 RepID=UPI001A2CA9D9|nr:Gfo/Idh/MocA family oxidoreductase [Raoultella ornithinolytica]HAT3821590.1 Gfo/Idh/MocA family oxidoreductase [Raoultella ornithinolytica]
MQTGFVGLGAVVETAYLPALRHLGILMNECWGFDANPGRRLPGITRCASLAAVLGKPLDLLFITTASLQHLPVLEAALASACPRIVVEKPVVATLEQMTRLRELLNEPQHARRVLALDHWMARDGALKLALGELDERWQGEDAAQPRRPLLSSIQDISRIDGFLQEPSGFNDQGEPVALNFATGEPDTRQLRHPDGVILDIGTHVLAMLRETIRYCGGTDEMHLEVRQVSDRLGHAIARGDTQTAEGKAHLQGQLSGIPLNIWLNKYAGPAGGQKGLRIWLRDGRIINQDRRDNCEVVELIAGDRIERWRRPGAIYEHCLGEHILGTESLFVRAPEEVSRLTQRRINEVALLLELQQQLRGPH